MTADHFARLRICTKNTINIHIVAQITCTVQCIATKMFCWLCHCHSNSTTLRYTHLVWSVLPPSLLVRVLFSFFCLSVSRITHKVIAGFTWNLQSRYRLYRPESSWLKFGSDPERIRYVSCIVYRIFMGIVQQSTDVNGWSEDGKTVKI